MFREQLTIQSVKENLDHGAPENPRHSEWIMPGDRDTSEGELQLVVAGQLGVTAGS